MNSTFARCIHLAWFRRGIIAPPGSARLNRAASHPLLSRCLCIALLALFFQSGTAFAANESLPDDDEYYLDAVSRVIPDPLERWNRGIFAFNDAVIGHVARPVYRGYGYITPSFMRTGVKNFFHNLAFPVRFTNNLLQGRGKAAGVEMSRFILNTTAGLGGLFDVARRHRPVVDVEDEDLGQTLGVWGVGEGFYIVWPLLGPSTARDSAGTVGDYFLHPLTYVHPWELGLGAKAAGTFNDLDEVLDLYDNLKQAAIEPYSSVRDAYVQYRRAKLTR
jgi:phospholipid-binding lipoprotein MlaA